MLVQFVSKGQFPYNVDSSRIYAAKNGIYFYGEEDCGIEVDDATLAYLKNAWAHEGMRRVLYSAASGANDSGTRTITHDNKGWYFEGSIYDDIGKLVISQDPNIRFIPYEMEENNA